MIRVATTAFNYTAIDAGGKQKKGTIEAASLDAARANLKNQGLTQRAGNLPEGTGQRKPDAGAPYHEVHPGAEQA